MLPKALYDGLRFPEGARWHDGMLWFSDMHTGEIFRADAAAGKAPEVAAQIDDQPSGLAWLGDGSLLVSSMLRRVVVRDDLRGHQSVYADLSGLTEAPINDMVLARGTLYLGGFGYDLYGDAPQKPGPLFAITEANAVTVAADDLVFPNGSVVLPDDTTLVVAETWAARLTAFDILESGSLGNRRVWADLPDGSTPDGLTVDVRGGVWVSCITNERYIRVVEGGEVTDIVDVPGRCPADCALGGDDGRSLFLLSANSWQPSETEVRQGRIDTVRVDVPGF